MKQELLVAILVIAGCGPSQQLASGQCVPLHAFRGEADDFAGFSVAGGEDVDGDLVPDLLIGSIQARGNRPGQLTILSGATGGVIRTVEGHAPNSQFGHSVSFVGDIDGDHVSEIAVGAPRELGLAGRVYIYSGASGAQLFRFSGDGPGLGFGSNVAGPGDVDADGVPDIVITGPRIAGSEPSARVFVNSGRTGTRIWTFFTGGAGLLSVSAVGDVDSDGHADVLIGSPRSYCGGFAAVYSGRDGNILWAVTGKDDGACAAPLGHAVAGVGDLNEDGVPDVAVGMPDDGTPSRTGHVIMLSGFDGSLIRTLTDARSASLFGSAIANAGDMNGDGTDDIIVGSPAQESTGQSVNVFSGRDGCLLRWILASDEARQFGSAVAGAGDLNGDGFADFAIGAYTDDGPNLGRAWIWPGFRSADFTCDGVTNSQDFFAFLEEFFAGTQRADVNGDGDPTSQDFFDFLAAFFTTCI